MRARLAAMNSKTSLSHPLEIADLPIGPGQGKIGVTFAPGKYDPSAATGSWNRDLATDLDAIANWDASLVLTLLEDHEMAQLRIQNLGDEVVRRKMEWLHLPIPDVSAPSADFDAAWPAHSERIQEMLRDGAKIVVHCRGGIERAGMMQLGSWSNSGTRPTRRSRRSVLCDTRGLSRQPSRSAGSQTGERPPGRPPD